MSTYFFGTSGGSNRQLFVQRPEEYLSYRDEVEKQECEKMFGKLLTTYTIVIALLFIGACRKDQPPDSKKLTVKYKKQLREDPKNIAARLGLGKVYIAREMLKQAVDEFQKATEIDSTSFEAYHELGVALRKLDKYDEAIRALHKAIQLDSLAATAYNSLGLTYYQKGEKEKALDAFLEAVRLDPKCAEAHYNLGAMYRDLKDSEKSSYHWQRYRELLK